MTNPSRILHALTRMKRCLSDHSRGRDWSVHIGAGLYGLAYSAY